MTENTEQVHSLIEREIIEMHEFFMTWFHGSCEQSREVFVENLEEHFADGFEIIFPNGFQLPGAELFAQMYSGYGNNPTFRTAIRNVQTRFLGDHIWLAVYEEWQKNAKNIRPSQNGRLSTALFRVKPLLPNGLAWLHIHETWLPEGTQRQASYDF